MPSAHAVHWIDSAEQIDQVIANMLSGSIQNQNTAAGDWFAKINQQPANKASERIWAAFDELLN